MSEKKPKKRLYDLIGDIEVAMLTTVAAGGKLVSRPMVTQKITNDDELWFVTTNETVKTDEIEANPEVNVAYYKLSPPEWTSVSGVARLSHDKKRIAQIYSSDWAAWLEDKGGAYDCGPGDPRFLLINVDISSAHVMTVPGGTAEIVFDSSKH